MKHLKQTILCIAHIDNTECNVMIIICHINDEKQIDRSKPQSLEHQIQVLLGAII